MNKNLEILSFVLDEIQRFRAFAWEDLKKCDSADLLSSIPHPGGQGHITIGLAADRKLLELSAFAISKSSWAGRIHRQSVHRCLSLIISKRLVKEQRDLTQSEADKIVSAATRMASRDVISLIHYLPCHLASSTFDGGFEIGPVTFLPTDTVLPEINSKIDTYLTQLIDADDDQEERAIRIRLLQGTIEEYYRNFGWAARIQVSDADAQTSERIASRTTQHAMNCLHILLGKSNSNRMQICGAGISQKFDSIARFDTNGAPRLSVSKGSIANILTEGWWETFQDGDWPRLRELMGQAVEVSLRGDALPHLVERFLDGASWYQQAIKGETAGSRIIKYISAIERLLSTKKEEELVKVLANRGAAILCMQRNRRANADGIMKDIKDVYEIRSDLVHGSRSPIDPRVEELESIAERLAREILIGCLVFYSIGHFLSTNNTYKDLDRGLSKLMAHLTDQHGVVFDTA